MFIRNLYRKIFTYRIRKIRSDIFYWGKMVPRYILYIFSMELLRRVIVKNKLASIQIGAGAGYLDPILKRGDGFHSLLSNVYKSFSSPIYLYEPNELNIENLKKSWELFKPHYKVFQEGLSIDGEESIDFYMHPSDGPNFQVCSIDPSHVLKHFTNSKIEDLITFKTKCRSINTIINRIENKKFHNFFIAIDAEGIDYKAVKTLLKSTLITNCFAFSFESKHLTRIQYLEIEKLAINKEFTKAGLGVDPYFCDTLYVRKKYFYQNLNSFSVKILDKIDYLWREIIII